MTVNDRVDRNESRETTGATVLAIEGDSALIAYDEGGKGWWPVTELTELTALSPITDQL